MNSGKRHGARVEAGIGLNRARAAVDLFGGWEQVVEAYPTERAAKRWGFAAFRIARNEGGNAISWRLIQWNAGTMHCFEN